MVVALCHEINLLLCTKYNVHIHVDSTDGNLGAVLYGWYAISSICVPSEGFTESTPSEERIRMVR